MLLVAHRTPATAPGCAALAAAGAGVFEVDLQLRPHGIVVSHFLPFLQISGWLEHDNWRFRWRSGPPRDATLLDLLGLVPADCAILLDPKETRPERRAQLAEELARTLPDRGRCYVSTDYPEDLERYRAAGFRTWRTIKDRDALRAALGSATVPEDGVSVRHSLLNRATVEALHEVVDTVVAWTVNDTARARQLVGIGVDGITTDRTRVLAAVGGGSARRGAT